MAADTKITLFMFYFSANYVKPTYRVSPKMPHNYFHEIETSPTTDRQLTNETMHRLQLLMWYDDSSSDDS